jgi:hypothetical protein
MFLFKALFFLLNNAFSKIKIRLNAAEMVPPNYKKINETQTMDNIFSHFHKQNLLQKLESNLSTSEKLSLIHYNMDLPFVYNMNNGGLMRDFFE